MAELTLLHNTACSTSRHALAEAEAAGREVEVVQYLKNPLTRDELLALIDKLEDPAADLVRKDKFFRDQGLDASDHTTPDQVADLLVQHPRLMERPVLIQGNQAIIGRPKDRVPTFLAAGG